MDRTYPNVCDRGCRFEQRAKGAWAMTWCPLHAAAPDLLAALERISDHELHANVNCPAWMREQARAAIAKAKREG